MKNKSLTTGLIWAAILAAAIYFTSCTVNHYYVFVIKERPSDEIHLYQPLSPSHGFQDWGITPYFKVDTTNQEWYNPNQITLDEWIIDTLPIITDTASMLKKYINHEN